MMSISRALLGKVTKPLTCYPRWFATESSVSQEPELDKLYRKLELELRGHDPAVLRSYKMFVVKSAEHLEIPFVKSWTPPKYHDRRTLLRAAFAKKKYMEQYEARTYFQVIEFEKLTGSTADTYLEYIERNLPEGVAMKVTKHEIRPLPEHLQPRPVEQVQ